MPMQLPRYSLHTSSVISDMGIDIVFEQRRIWPGGTLRCLHKLPILLNRSFFKVRSSKTDSTTTCKPRRIHEAGVHINSA